MQNNCPSLLVVHFDGHAWHIRWTMDISNSLHITLGAQLLHSTQEFGNLDF